MPLADPYLEANRVASAAQKAGITLNLIGGAAIRICCPSAGSIEALRRAPKDLDYMAHLSESRVLKETFIALGYDPNKVMNAIQGRKRLQFFDRENGRQVDVFLDLFEMCHSFDLRRRLDPGRITVPVADLFLTKLQIVEQNEKDVRDLLALLLDHPVDLVENGESVSGYLADLCRRNWGLWQTVLDSLENVEKHLPGYSVSPADRARLQENIRLLRSRLEEVPKTTAWKLRAAVGKKVQWYQLPEEQKR